MAYVIPKDPQVMARKGALFIVADGMGGHAAGEVASEIAVDTVSNVYYQDDSDDVAVSLLHAIRRANTLIHQRAAENMLRSGMGTTCVAAAMRGSTAYIANVGDSRAYILRKGQVRQVSQDHSWVEEQVRAGLLTRDQARAHAQRNVITRCLGTQAEVEVDVFCEPLEEGDTLVLCSDGLSGLIADDEMRAIVDQYLPQESVYHLVERANENGGSDNITAIVIRVQEVGWEPPGAPRPAFVGGRESEDTAILGVLPAPAMNVPTYPGNGRVPSSPLFMPMPRIPSGPLASPDVTSPLSPPVMPVSGPLPARSRSRGRLLWPMLTVLVLLILVIASGGAYYFYWQTQNAAYVDQLLKDAKTGIQQANAQVQNNPSAALQKLVDVQKKLHTVQNSRLNATETTTLNKLLQNDFTSTVRSAITNYNMQTQISSIPCPNAQNVVVASMSNGSVTTQPGSVVSVKNSNTTSSYALGDDLNLYQVTDDNQGHALGNKIPLSGTGTIQAASNTSIAADGSRFVVLTASNSTYTLQTFVPNAQGVVTKAASVATVDPALIKKGMVPKFVTAWNQDIYVVLTATTGSTSSEVLDFTLDHDNFKPNNGSPRAVQISSSATIRSFTALPNNQLFLLLDDGNIQSLQLGGNSAAPVSVQMQQPIPSPLSTSAAGFTANTLVPTPSPALSSDFLAVPGATALASGSVVIGPNTTQHLYVVDPTNHRTLDLIVSPAAASLGTQTPVATPATKTPTASATAKAGATPAATSNGAKPVMQARLYQQFVSASLLATVKSIAADPAGNGIDLLTQSGANNSNLNFITVDVRQQSPC
jgi:serine/threonine protein phosphatase PrpC